MSIYHCSAKIISRGNGQSAIASSAYRSRESLFDERENKTFNYSRKQDLVYKEIISPNNAPDWVQNRERLWNEVEKAEKRVDSQLAREFEIAIPRELERAEQINLIRDYVRENFVDKGMIADICIHDKDGSNPHAHIMITMRELNEKGFGKKNRDWNAKELLEEWRASWSEKANLYLEKNKIEQKIDHRSFEKMGLNLLPTVHEGYKVRKLEARGIETQIGTLNRGIKLYNETLKEIDNEIKKLEKEKEIISKIEKAEKTIEKQQTAEEIKSLKIKEKLIEMESKTGERVYIKFNPEEKEVRISNSRDNFPNEIQSKSLSEILGEYYSRDYISIKSTNIIELSQKCEYEELETKDKEKIFINNDKKEAQLIKVFDDEFNRTAKEKYIKIKKEKENDPEELRIKIKEIEIKINGKIKDLEEIEQKRNQIKESESRVLKLREEIKENYYIPEKENYLNQCKYEIKEIYERYMGNQEFVKLHNNYVKSIEEKKVGIERVKEKLSIEKDKKVSLFSFKDKKDKAENIEIYEKELRTLELDLIKLRKEFYPISFSEVKENLVYKIDKEYKAIEQEIKGLEQEKEGTKEKYIKLKMEKLSKVIDLDKTNDKEYIELFEKIVVMPAYLKTFEFEHKETKEKLYLQHRNNNGVEELKSSHIKDVFNAPLKDRIPYYSLDKAMVMIYQKGYELIALERQIQVSENYIIALKKGDTKIIIDKDKKEAVTIRKFTEEEKENTRRINKEKEKKFEQERKRKREIDLDR